LSAGNPSTLAGRVCAKSATRREGSDGAGSSSSKTGGGGYVDLFHPVCFADAHGVDKRLDAVHRRDLLSRGLVPDLMTNIDELRQQLRESI
jgi:hypothetical protein